MIHSVLAAFGATGFAHFCAKAAQLLRESRATAHECRRSPTALSAVAVEADALSHFRDIRFLQTHIGAMLAFLCACYTGFDALLVDEMGHFIFSLWTTHWTL